MGCLHPTRIAIVAVIKAHGNDFRTLTLGDSDRLQVWKEVVAIRQSPFARIDGFKRHCQRDANCGGRRGQICADHCAYISRYSAARCSIWQGKWSASRLLISKAERILPEFCHPHQRCKTDATGPVLKLAHAPPDVPDACCRGVNDSSLMARSSVSLGHAPVAKNLLRRRLRDARSNLWTP